jgi:uncharacterized protein (TIGR02145 family)
MIKNLINKMFYSSERTIIDSQTWMIQNLNVDRYQDGSLIPQAKSNDQWVSFGEEHKGCWCYYNNDQHNGEKFGKLYNWFALDTERCHGGIAPKGWHIPSFNEYFQLLKNLGVKGSRDESNNVRAANELKGIDRYSNRKINWNGLLGGIRITDGNFLKIDQLGSWWTTTELIREALESDSLLADSFNAYLEEDKIDAWCLRLDQSSFENFQIMRFFPSTYGLSVRCIKNN